MPLTDQEYQQMQQIAKQPTIGGGQVAPVQPLLTPAQQQDLIDQTAGAGGGIAGQAGGAILGPLGIIGGGALIGGLAQGGAEYAQEAKTGKGINWANVLSQGGQGAAYGAIPLVDEAREAKIGAEATGDVAKTGIVQQAIKKILTSPKSLTAKGLATRIAIRGATGFGGGYLGQAAQNYGQKENLQQSLTNPNDLFSGGISGAVNTLLPGLGTLGKMAVGSSKGIANSIAKHFVGNDLASEPVVRNALQLVGKTGSNKQLQALSRDNLSKVADSKMMELDKLLEGKTAKKQDFINAAQKDVNKIFDPKLQGTDLMKYTSDYINNQIKDLSNNSKQYLADNADVPLNILNEIKRGLNRISYGANGESKNYTNAFITHNVKDFIEKAAEAQQEGAGAEVSRLNDEWSKLNDASDIMKQKFGKLGSDIPMAREVGWMARMGLSSALGLGAATAGYSAGSPYAGGLTAAPFALFALNATLMHNPERAAQYAKALGITAPVLTHALQQLGVRALQTYNQQQRLSPTNQ